DPVTRADPDLEQLTAAIRTWAHQLGFDGVGISTPDLRNDRDHLDRWLALERHGGMHYMARHRAARAQPDVLVPGTLRVISVRMPHLPPGAESAEHVLADPTKGYVARYALGRDYHRIIRPRLQKLADRIVGAIGPFGYRAFVDSAPVLEKALARDAGLGWIGKHTLLLDRSAGSWFLLGELFTDLPLPVDAPVSAHCGSCRACIDVCPTGAIVAPYELDARRCISYLTIEHHGSIPVELRPLIGNRIFGCDDCQLVCPWNRYARLATEPDFAPRAGLDGRALTELFHWDERQYLRHTEGMALRRVSHERWLRNVAVALGNAPRSDAVIAALRERLTHPSQLVREHVAWALAQQSRRDPVPDGGSEY
ncbi:MAG TPA: tRNA epoxyqueuosine(34) reductase QueG, partial [Steroidobacteraceae bacterium]|nr:tRNA epoxyqueuosine(34) reductase QueG [Steroidobacteraceae bacterium]